MKQKNFNELIKIGSILIFCVAVLLNIGPLEVLAQDPSFEDPTAFAASAAPGGGGSLIMQKLGELLPLFLIVFLIFWFMVLRPQEKQHRSHEKMLSDLKSGVLVKTQAGIIGKVVSVHDDYVMLEIANGTKVKFERQAVLGRVEKEASDSASVPSNAKRSKSKQSA